MRYEIKGETLPVVVCYLEDGEQMFQIADIRRTLWYTTNI